MPELTRQQQIALDEHIRLLEHIIDSNDRLDDKAGLILQSGSLIIALTGAVTIPTFVSQPTTAWHYIALILAFLGFIGMLVFSILAWFPGESDSPGTRDFNEMTEKYLSVELNECYSQVLANTLNVAEKSYQHNRYKGNMVKIAACLLIAQIVGVFALAMLTVFWG